MSGRGYDDDGNTQPGDLYVGQVTTLDGHGDVFERPFPFGFQPAAGGWYECGYRPVLRHLTATRSPRAAR